jgi:CBS domain-containing protein
MMSQKVGWILPMPNLQVVTPEDTVSDVMTGWVVTVSPSDSLLKARDLMTHNRVSQLVVVDHRTRPVGVISKRDIARFLLDDSTTRPLEEMLVSEACSETIPTLRPDLPIFNAARLFDTDNLAYAIIGDETPVAGIMTETDLCHYFARKFPGRFKVDEFMTRDFIFAKSSYPVVHVAHAIAFRQPSVPVIDEELVGILTLTDLLEIRERAPTHRRLSMSSQAESDAALLTTKDLMTRNPVTTNLDADLAQAAQIIINKGVGSLPVVDKGSYVVGLLTKHDIVRALGRIGSSLTTEV